MTPQRQAVLDALAEDEQVQFLEGEEFDVAILGLGQQFTDARCVCYDRARVIAVLQAEGMDEEAAEEYFGFNVGGAYVGETTPIFVDPVVRPC